MGLSSNSLIHLTDEKEKLFSILSGEFKLHYCLERLHTNNGTLMTYIPVVSFFDIPFSQIGDHFFSYGSYGIGLKKKWAQNNGLNPVIYLERESHLVKNYIRLHFEAIIGDSISVKDLPIEKKKQMDVFRYMKNYQSTLFRLGKEPIPNYRFSDEREWRYVLPIDSTSLFFGNANGAEKKTEEQIKEEKKIHNELILNETLKFSPEDINYIIIKSEDERIEFVEKIDSIYKRDTIASHIDRLKSRIISVEQINSDF